MTKTILGIIILIAFVVITASVFRESDLNPFNVKKDFSSPLPKFSPVSVDLSPEILNVERVKGWAVFEEYLLALKNHDVEIMKDLSYRISTECKDKTRQEECYGLMDNVYKLANHFELADFTHTETDGRQLILHTDGPRVSALYFIKNSRGEPKILGLRFCIEGQVEIENCSPIVSKTDANENGWWDSIESLFTLSPPPQPTS